MEATIVVCLCIATNLHAEHIGTLSDIATSISTSTNVAQDSSLSSGDVITSPSSLFDVKMELAKIAASCLSSRDYELLAGNIVKHGVVRGFAPSLVGESVMSIGLTELRATLNFGPLRPWEPYNNTKPSDGELASAPTLEAYYDLIEPRSSMGSLDSLYLLEQNLPPAIAYLDKRFPSIRAMFRDRFENMRLSQSAPEELDRKAIERWIEEFFVIRDRINNATERMLYFNNDEC